MRPAFLEQEKMLLLRGGARLEQVFAGGVLLLQELVLEMRACLLVRELMLPVSRCAGRERTVISR